jgi:peptide/nickel transport system substrate-binding protein
MKFADWMNTPEAKRDPSLNIGSGPYVYDEWRTQELLRLRKSKRYWGESVNPWMRATAPELLFRTIPDRSSAVTALKNNELDFMSFVPATMYDEEVDTSRMTHLAKRTYIMPTYMYIGWNTRKAVLSDKRVRRAFSHLVDRDQLMKQIARGYASPTNSPVYPMRPEYDSTIPAIAYDPAKAAALLAEAGWIDTDGDGTRDKIVNGQKTDLRFSFLLNAGNESRERIALFLVDEFKRVGVDVRVQKLEWSVFLENLRTHKFDCYIGAWVNDDIPSDPYQLWHSTQSKVKGSNYVGFVNRRADEIMEANRVEFDAAKRELLMHEFQRIVVEEQPYTFLWLQHYPSVYNKRLGNVSFYTIRPGYHPPSWSIAP